MFFVNHIQQKQCECGKKGEIIEFDRNLFAETVNVIQLLKAIDQAMDAEKDLKLPLNEQKMKGLKAVKDRFFRFVCTMIETSSGQCIRDKEGNIPKDVTNNPTKHRTKYQNKLQQPMPEVLTFNLIWDQNPKPSDILKVLTTLPEVFLPRDMFGASGEKTYYVLRGMICF